jgi:hypothetical protein
MGISEPILRTNGASLIRIETFGPVGILIVLDPAQVGPVQLGSVQGKL